MQTNDQIIGAPPERPSNYLVFAIVLLVILLPLSLLLGASSLYTVWVITAVDLLTNFAAKN